MTPFSKTGYKYNYAKNAAENADILFGKAKGSGIRMATQALQIPKIISGSPLGSAVIGAADLIRKHLIQKKPFTGESGVDTAIRAAHPLLGLGDVIAKETTGKSLREGFIEGTTMSGDVRVPPWAF
jgi:hypothetical protein